MDKKEERRKKKEEPVKSVSPKPANHSRRPPFRPGICVCVSLCVWIQSPGRYRYGSLNLDTEGEG